MDAEHTKCKPVTIASLELENVKRVRAVRLTPTTAGLTVIGGDNCQGKTSILDGICYALGGERYRPTNLQREGGAADARIEIELSNGLKVERKGKNATLKVTDPSGGKGGQKLLDSFVEELALNLPKFLAMNGRDKAGVLLRVLGIGDQLAALDAAEKAAYDERHAQGRIADQKEKYAAEMPEHHDAPADLVTAADLVRESQAIMQRNAERAAARARVSQLDHAAGMANTAAKSAADVVQRLRAELERAVQREKEAATTAEAAMAALREAKADPIGSDESTAEIQSRMDEIEQTNAKVRANLDKRKAVEDASHCRSVYDQLTQRVEAVRAERMALLAGAEMPLPGLSVQDGELTYNGKAWDCMSSAEQVRAGVAIVRRLKPECGFVLLDGLERFDVAQLEQLGEWLTAEGLQAIATRVSSGDECSIIIEDGLVAGQAAESVENTPPAADAAAELADW